MKVTIELNLEEPLDVEELCGILQGAVNAQFYIVPVKHESPNYSLKDLVETWTEECLKIELGERLLIGGALGTPSKRAYANFLSWVRNKKGKNKITRQDFIDSLQDLGFYIGVNKDKHMYLPNAVLINSMGDNSDDEMA